MSKNKKTESVRVIYKKDLNLSRVGFTDVTAAKVTELELLKTHPEPTYRVRTRLRTRTNTWDVVVKVRTEVEA